MLCDPFKYQDYIKKYLDDIEEENKERLPLRKRTRSNNFFPTTQLHEIDEETYE